MKKIATIMGDINPNEIGITLPHEHVVVDQWAYAENPLELHQRRKRNEPVTLENRGDVEWRPFCYPDDLVMDDVNVSIDEGMDFKSLGGKTLVDLTPWQLGRSVEALYEFAAKTGLNVVFGGGDYISQFWSEEDKKRSKEDIKKRYLSEFLDGIGFLKVKPGIIGEIGLWDLKDEYDVKGLSAAAMAQGAIGCPLNIHPTLFASDGKHAKDGHKILDIIEESGGNAEKTCLSHCDLTYYDADYHDSLAKRGAYIEFDQFGMYIMTMLSLPGKYLPSDLHRVDAIKEQISRGNIDKILISHDASYKHLFKKWGGHGYSHIIENIVPMMRDYAGISEEDIYKILIENPKTI